MFRHWEVLEVVCFIYRRMSILLKIVKLRIGGGVKNHCTKIQLQSLNMEFVPVKKHVLHPTYIGCLMLCNYMTNTEVVRKQLSALLLNILN